jgi:autotransporter translocation and assembly factor TamB
MLQRLFIWALVSFAIIGIVAAGGLFVLLRTAPGQRLVLDLALPRLAEEAGFGIEVGSTSGAWPAEIQLRGVRLTDRHGVWFEAERMAVIWHPALALSGGYFFDAVDIERGHLVREPEFGGGVAGISRPHNYPRLRIGAIQAEDFRLDEPVIGQELVLNLKGGLELGARGDVLSSLDIELRSAGLVSGKLAEILGEHIRISARVRGMAGRTYAFEGLTAASTDAVVNVAGELNYDVASQGIVADLTGSIDPEIAAKIDARLAARTPVELSIHAQGPWQSLAIHLTGGLPALALDRQSIARSDLTADLTLGDRRLAGPVRVDFANASREATQERISGSFFWDRKAHIHLTDLVVDYRGARATGELDLDTNKNTGRGSAIFAIPELANLPLPVHARGAVRGDGIIEFGDALRLDAHLMSPRLELAGTAIEDLALTTFGTTNGFTAEISARSVRWLGLAQANAISLGGELARDGTGTRITVERFTADIGERPAHLAAPIKLTLGADEIVLSEADLRWGDAGRIRLQGALGKEILAHLSIQSIELPFAPLLASGEMKVNTGRVDAGDLQLTLVPIDAEGPQLRAVITGRWTGERLQLAASIEGFGQDAAFGRIEPVKLSLPLELERHAGSFDLATGGPIEGRVQYKGAIDRFLLLAPLAEQTATGKADLDLVLSGMIASPQVAGTVTLTDGTYENLAIGVFLDHMNLHARAKRLGDGNVVEFDASASDGRGGPSGPTKAEGRLLLGANPRLDATVRFDHARIVHTAQMSLEASGNIQLGGQPPHLLAKGVVALHTFEFQIPKAMPPDLVEVRVVNREAGERAATQEKKAVVRAPIDIALDITMAARQEVYIRGRGLDSEWSANLHATGTDAAPVLDGMLTLRRGRFDFSGRRFDLAAGTIHFVPSRSSDPDLSIQARNRVASGTTAIIDVSGRASHPEIRLSSDPPLPQDDVMALVLFGRPAERLSPLQALQVANAIATLTGDSPLSGGTGILDRARTGLGLDLLDVSVDDEGSSVIVGKYLRRGVFVSASPGIGDKPGSVATEIELSKSVSVETKVGQDAQESVGVIWKHDY